MCSSDLGNQHGGSVELVYCDAGTDVDCAGVAGADYCEPAGCDPVAGDSEAGGMRFLVRTSGFEEARSEEPETQTQGLTDAVTSSSICETFAAACV